MNDTHTILLSDKRIRGDLPNPRVACNHKLKIVRDGKCECKFGPIHKNKPNTCRSKCPKNTKWNNTTKLCVSNRGNNGARTVRSVEEMSRDASIQKCMNITEKSKEWCQAEYEKNNK